MATAALTLNPLTGKPLRKCRAKITEQDAYAIAALVARKLTEAEACAKLDLHPGTWAHWKIRHANTFEQALTRVRAEKVHGLLDTVEAHGVDDWRAAAWILKTLWPERYGDRLTVAVKGLIQVGTVSAMRPGLPEPKQAQVVDIAEVKVENKGVLIRKIEYAKKA